MGMNAKNGRKLEGIEHIQQSIRDILTTPIGSRVMRRDYGSLVPELIDMPQSDALLMQVYAATVIAVTRWEPRIQVTGVRRNINTQQPGAVTLALYGKTTEGESANIEVPIL